MLKVRMAFYKVQKGDVWGNIIASWTGLFNWGEPRYCHVEIGFPRSSGDPGELWYSSASRNADGTTGTRWTTDKELFKHPDRWDVYDVFCVRQIESMLDTCNAERGKAYDWLGIAGFATVFGQLNAKNKWYCSEICHYVFFGYWKKRIGPSALYREIKSRIVRDK